MEVHPAASVFPMLTDEELDDLAADIKDNGLQQPIVMSDGVLIDGRNRLIACERAGVEPTFTELNGDDPVAYIGSANLARRDLTPGQKALLIAQMAKFGQLKHGKKGEVASEYGVNRHRLTEAADIWEYAPELATQLIADPKSNPFYTAAAEARRRKEIADEGVDKATRIEALKAEAPDLWERLDIGELKSLEEAEALLSAREEENERQRQVATRLVDTSIGGLVELLGSSIPLDELAVHYADKYAGTYTIEDMEAGVKFASQVVKAMKGTK